MDPARRSSRLKSRVPTVMAGSQLIFSFEIYALIPSWPATAVRD